MSPTSANASEFFIAQIEPPTANKPIRDARVEVVKLARCTSTLLGKTSCRAK